MSDLPTTSCTGAVLVGGRSSRMGSPKHELVLPDGRSIMSHVVGAMRAVCQRVVIVHAHGSPVADGAHTVRDLRPQAGPLGGIESLLASGVDNQYLVCPCDVPLVTPDMLQMLLASPDSLASVFQIEDGDEIEPLPARIRAEALPIVRRLLNRQRRSVWRLMDEIQPHVVSLAADEAVQLLNVNSRSDYEEVLRVVNVTQRAAKPR